MSPLKTAFLLTSIGAFVAATPVLFNLTATSNDNWAQKKCSDQYIDDAQAPSATRWEAADAGDAWQAVILGWNQESPPAGDVSVNFSVYVGNFFQTKDRLACENLADNPCDDTISCEGVTPAGYMIVNSMVILHSIQKAIYSALTPALALMQTHLNTFQKTFAPQVPSDASIIKEMLDGILLATALASAVVWNFVAKEAEWFAVDSYRLFSKDTANALISVSFMVSKDTLPTSSTPDDIEGQLSDALGTYFSIWESAQVDYLHRTFQGDTVSLSTLSKAFNDGLMLSTPTPDLGTVETQVQHIIYSQMVLTAWNIAPAHYYPFILKTSNPCSSTVSKDLRGYMDDTTAAQTHVCYDGFTFYVVYASWPNTYDGTPQEVQFNPLPGGTWDNMQNSIWAGLSLDDFVISSWEGYKLNGMQNGYSPSNGSYSDTGILFGDGVQTAGFASLPICEQAQALRYVMDCN